MQVRPNVAVSLYIRKKRKKYKFSKYILKKHQNIFYGGMKE